MKSKTRIEYEVWLNYILEDWVSYKDWLNKTMNPLTHPMLQNNPSFKGFMGYLLSLSDGELEHLNYPEPIEPPETKEEWETDAKEAIDKTQNG